VPDGIPEANRSDNATPRPGSVLVVDDNGVNRYLLAQSVTNLGHHATVAPNGRVALDLLAGEPFDLVLLDLLMPEMDGYAVLERMKAEPRWREIPVIMVSGQDEIASVIRCIALGAEDYLPKPWDPILLRARIEACLEKKRLRDEQRKKSEELEQTLVQLRRTQDQLIMQEKLASLGTLTAGIAHEIKNPLNFVTNFAQLAVDLVADLRRELGGQRDRLAAEVVGEVDDLLCQLEQCAGKIDEHGKRADSIVRGMLMHSRNRPGERQPSDINALVAQSVSLAYHSLRGQDPAFNVAIEADYDPAIGMIGVIPQDLGRVFLNIAHNACYAAHEWRKSAGAAFAPRIRVTTRDRGDCVEVRIHDNGGGIPEHVRDKIFNPFFTTKPTGAGTGLGLSISYDIVVQSHGGCLRVETEQGSHSDFIIEIPKDRR
jgi:signal transduction histidine kinase